MTTAPTHSLSPFVRRAAFVAFTLLSLYLPTIVARWSVARAFAGLAAGAKISEIDYFESKFIKDGELWFTSSRANKRRMSFDNIVKRLDLKTGKTRTLGNLSPGRQYFPLSLGNEVYVVGLNDIYQVVDDSLVKMGSYPGHQKARSNLFLFEEKLTVVASEDEIHFRLIHFVDGQWIDGLEILTPSPGQDWFDDPQTGRIRLMPVSSLQFDPSEDVETTSRFNVHIDGDRILLFLVRFSRDPNNRARPKFCNFFRQGFEFANTQSELASALAPENATRECSGWEPTTRIAPNGKTTILDIPLNAVYGGPPAGTFISCDATGPLFCFMGSENHGDLVTNEICRRGSDGYLRPMSGLTPDTRSTLAIDSSDGTAYVIEQSCDGWNSLAFRRIEGNTILPAFLTMQGGAKAYIQRWRQLFLYLVLAWLLHFLLMLVASTFLSSSESQIHYEYDFQLATVASIWRRMLASSVDLLMLAALLIGIGYGLSAWPGVRWTDADDVELGDRLHLIRLFATEFLHQFDGWEPMHPQSVRQILVAISKGFNAVHLFYSRWFSIAFILCGLILCIEGLTGITAGKWLSGIRTTGWTLTRAGIMSAIGRAAFCPIDFFFFLTPIPAITFMLMSKNHRRLGDIFARTIVVNAGSIRNADWYKE